MKKTDPNNGNDDYEFHGHHDEHEDKAPGSDDDHALEREKIEEEYKEYKRIKDTPHRQHDKTRKEQHK